mmetsp:Transcript_114935/g.312082  ORF Transcript_114935/g.312082 Transcript_114935/m.312082 type:complete len:285 (-) Transcript_114935:987-1841(-)
MAPTWWTLGTRCPCAGSTSSASPGTSPRPSWRCSPRTRRARRCSRRWWRTPCPPPHSTSLSWPPTSPRPTPRTRRCTRKAWTRRAPGTRCPCSCSTTPSCLGTSPSPSCSSPPRSRRGPRLTRPPRSRCPSPGSTTPSDPAPTPSASSPWPSRSRTRGQHRRLRPPGLRPRPRPSGRCRPSGLRLDPSGCSRTPPPFRCSTSSSAPRTTPSTNSPGPPCSQKPQWSSSPVAAAGAPAQSAHPNSPRRYLDTPSAPPCSTTPSSLGTTPNSMSRGWHRSHVGIRD